MIDEIKYLKLTKIFNDILKSTQSNLELISIPWMHIIREHPIFLDRYEKLFKYCSLSARNILSFIVTPINQTELSELKEQTFVKDNNFAKTFSELEENNIISREISDDILVYVKNLKIE